MGMEKLELLLRIVKSGSPGRLAAARRAATTLPRC